jgi:hypothetical protein
MPKMNTGFPQEPILLEDRYPAVLKECTEYEKVYKENEGPVQKIAWVFEVTASEAAIDTDVEFEGDAEADRPFEIAAHTSLATGPNSNFAALNFPAWVGEGWDGDTDSLIGKEAIVDVTSYETKGGQVRNVIEKVRVPKKSAKASKKAEQEEAEDFDKIPF